MDSGAPEGRVMLWLAQTCSELRHMRPAKQSLERLLAHLHDLSDQEVAQAPMVVMQVGSPISARDLAVALAQRSDVPIPLDQVAVEACVAYVARMPVRHSHLIAHDARQALLLAIEPVGLRSRPSVDAKANDLRLSPGARPLAWAKAKKAAT